MEVKTGKETLNIWEIERKANTQDFRIWKRKKIRIFEKLAEKVI